MNDYQPKHLSFSKVTQQNLEILPESLCDEVLERLKGLEENHWFLRRQINSIPTKGTKVCEYWFIGGRQFPKDLFDYLISIAPLMDGQKPVEAIVNRYEVGMYMPEHIDSAPIRGNMVINLNADGDGIEIEGELFKDRKGFGTVFPMRSPPHAVPPVKVKRHVLIYHYE